MLLNVAVRNVVEKSLKVCICCCVSCSVYMLELAKKMHNSKKSMKIRQVRFMNHGQAGKGHLILHSFIKDGRIFFNGRNGINKNYCTKCSNE